MASIYRRGNVLWLRYRGADGKWTGSSSGLKVGDEKRARRRLELIEAQIAAGVVPDAGPLKLRDWFPTWLNGRKRQVQTWRNDDGVMRLHVLPSIGALQLDEVRPKHLVELVRGWRSRTGEDGMAPKTIYNAYSTVSAFFRDAALEGLVEASPCVLTKHQLGPKVDADPEWRQTAVYSQAELELLISDERVPMDRRVFYALQGCAGLRHGEAAGLLWRNVNRDAKVEPLGLLYVAFSYGRPFPKGDVPRPVPIHPTLAGVLAEWKLYGWKRLVGREPGADDLVVPRPPASPSKHGPWRAKNYSLRRLGEDLELLGLRHRRGHDLRRTFISLARSSGAEKDILRRATHKPPREVIEGYTTFEWPVVCREVSKLPVRRHETGKLIDLPRAAAAGDFATPLATLGPPMPELAAIQRATRVALPGLEPAQSAPVGDPLSPQAPDGPACSACLTFIESRLWASDRSNVASGVDELAALLSEVE